MQRDATVLVFDHGLFTCLAERLADFYSKVLYYVPWSEVSIGFEKLQVGDGLPGVTRVVNLWDVVDQVDLFVFPDVNDGSLANYLRQQGKRVWSSGTGEELELFRWEARQLFKKLGLPQLHAVNLTGTVALGDYLQEHQDKYVKLSRLRHVMETWHHVNWRISEPKVQQLTHCLGPLASELEFVVEDALPDAVEYGWDGFVVDGVFAQTAMLGLEVKDAGLVGAVKDTSKMPDAIKVVNERLGDVLWKHNYRGFFSTEVRIARDGTPYLLDPCCRMASPPGELYIELWTNLGDILWSGAGGELVNPAPLARYGAEVMAFSDWCDTNWCPITINDVVKRFVKLAFATVINGKRYVVPQAIHWRKVGAVIGMGDTLDAAIQHCQRNIKGVEGYELDIEATALDEAQAQVDKGLEFGVSF